MNWCELKLLTTGPEDNPACTVQIRFSYDAATIDNLKQHIRFTERSHNPQTLAWFVMPKDLPYARHLAMRFKQATLIEGNRITDLHSGAITEQLSMFEEG